MIYHLSDQGNFTPVGAQGGFHGTPPPVKATFPPEFCNEICTIYRVSKNVLYPKMQNFKNFYYSKDNQICYFDLIKW